MSASPRSLGAGSNDNINLSMESAETGACSLAKEVELTERIPGRLLMVLLVVVSALEGADQALLPITFHAMGEDLGLVITNMAVLSLAQALPQSIGAPVWGILADRGTLTRRALLVIGCAGWGIATGLMAVVTWWTPMILLRAVNGFMLACLRPICNGIIPDVTSEGCRGRIYGQLQVSLYVGNIFASLCITPLSGADLGGLAGWRVAFIFMGVLSVIMAVVVAFTMEEPERERNPGFEYRAPVVADTRGIEANGKPRWAWLATLCEEAGRLGRYIRMPSFCFVILQGFFGNIACNALVFTTLYFQSAGITDGQAGLMGAISMAAGGAGSLIGGLVGDALTNRWRYHGRPLTAQISIGAAVVLMWATYWGVPPQPDAFWMYLVLLVANGLTSTWVAAGVNSPILSELVDPEGRSTIMAWDCALEGASGAVFGSMGVSLIASALGYSLEGTNDASGEPNPDIAAALGKAMVLTAAGPWLVCWLFFSLLHWSYPRDAKRVALYWEQTIAKDSEGNKNSSVVPPTDPNPGVCTAAD